jgi:hypothetical protein
VAQQALSAPLLALLIGEVFQLLDINIGALMLTLEEKFVRAW